MAIIEVGGRRPEVLTGTEFEKAVRLVTDRFDLSESFTRSYFEKFYRWEKIYKRITKKKQYDWKANAFLPYAFSMVEQSVPRKITSILGSRPYVHVVGREQTDDIKAELVEQTLDYHYVEEIDLLPKAADLFRICDIYGKAIGLIDYRRIYEDRLVRKTVEIPLPTGGTFSFEQEQKERMTVYDAPWFEIVDLTDFFPQPGKRRITEMDWCIRRYYTTIDDLKEQERSGYVGSKAGGDDIDNIQDTSFRGEDDFKERRHFLDNYDDVQRFSDRFDRVVEVLEYWGRVPYDSPDGIKKRVIAIANRKIVIRNQPNPFWHGEKPFIEMDAIADPHSFYGVGKIEPVEHLTYIANEIMNMRLENVKMFINGLFVIDQNAGINKDQLISQPFGVVECLGNPQAAIQRLATGDITSSAYTESSLLYQLMQQATGITENIMGIPASNRATATEVQIKTESANARLNLEILLQEHQFLVSLSKRVIQLDNQFMPMQKYIRVTNNPMVQGGFYLTPNDVIGNFDYVPLGSTQTINKQARRSDATTLSQVILPYAQFLMAQGFDTVAYFREIFKIFEFRNADQLFKMPVASPAVNPMFQKLMASGAVPPEAMMGGQGAMMPQQGMAA